jgi:hypothetical protein
MNYAAANRQGRRKKRVMLHTYGMLFYIYLIFATNILLLRSNRFNIIALFKGIDQLD